MSFQVKQNFGSLGHARVLGLFTLALVLIFLSNAPAMARDEDDQRPVISEDQRAVQAVIAGQLQAFQDRDFATALSFADFPIQQMFSNPAGFADMVERGYEPIFNNQSHEFVQFNIQGLVATQVITVQSQQGIQAIAQYRLSKASGQWRIAGVLMQVLQPEKT